MKNLLTALFFLFSCTAFGQYYYTDILSNRQTNEQYTLISQQQLRKIAATGFDANDEPSKDFLLEQQIDAGKQQITTRSATIGSGESVFVSRYNNGRITSTYDSSANAVNAVEYRYDATGRLLATYATSKDFDGKFSSTEVHLFTYNDKGLPTQLVKVKNDLDTTYVSFMHDDNGNVAEETWRKNKRVVESYYYYYNQKNQLTDIVRYSRKARQLLPDYIFEYDNSGRLVQMTQAQANSANYLIYRYVYNPRGLKEKEQVYDKRKQYLGKMEYSYQ